MDRKQEYHDHRQNQVVRRSTDGGSAIAKLIVRRVIPWMLRVFLGFDIEVINRG